MQRSDVCYRILRDIERSYVVSLKSGQATRDSQSEELFRSPDAMCLDHDSGCTSVEAQKAANGYRRQTLSEIIISILTMKVQSLIMIIFLFFSKATISYNQTCRSLISDQTFQSSIASSAAYEHLPILARNSALEMRFDRRLVP